jgi:hypothetical protein
VADPTTADRSRLPPVPDRARHRAPLPAQPTSFVGREREVAAVVELLRRPDVRLVALTGPGGVGTTQLTLRVAEALEPHFAGDVVFGELTSLTDPDLVALSVANALVQNQAASCEMDRWSS